MDFEALSCKIECNELLVRLCSAIDNGENDSLPEFFTDDLTLCYPNGDVIKGEDAKTALRSRPKTIVTRHIMTNVVIAPTSPETARGKAYILIYRVPNDGSGPGPLVLPPSPQAAGDWAIDFRKTPSGWRVSRYAGVERLKSE